MAIKINGMMVDPDEQLMELDRADCEESLYEFLRQAWKYIDPSPWKDGWPIEAVAEHLQAVIDGEIRRLIINIPPRMGKSSITSVALPAWCWIQRRISPTSGPQTAFLHASYANQLSLRDSVKCRRLIESGWYQKMFGDRFKLTSDQNTKSRFSNDKGGERLITSIGAAVTGEGGSCFPAGTQVLIPNGSANIEDLRVEDEVYAFDHLRGKVVKSRVLATFPRTVSELYEIHTFSGHSFRCTANHPIYVKGRGYIRADQLGLGDRVIVKNWQKDLRQSDLRLLQKDNHQESVRGSQSFENWLSRCLLLKGLLFQSSRSKADETLRSVWNAQERQKNKVLLRGMQTSGKRRSKKEKALSLLSKAFLWPYRILQASMRGQCSFGQDEGFKEFQIQDSWSLFQSIYKNEGYYFGARQLPMRLMWVGGLVYESPLWWEKSDLARSPHRREHSKQHPRKFDYSLHNVSQEASQFGFTNIKSIERHSVDPITVYDIQVEKFSNFFAEGILVHNCIIVDDPNAANEAFSEATIGATKDWWDGTMSTRLNDPKTGAYIIIQQRLAEDDLTGHILSKETDQWTHLCLPMRYEPERSYITPIGWKDPRAVPNELMWPERFGEDEVKALERSLGPFASAGQLQQRPEPAGGGVIKRDWWQLWPDSTFPPMDFIIACLDTAYTMKTENDPSAMTVWGVFSSDTVAQNSRVLGADGRPMYVDRTYADGAPKVMLMHAWSERLAFHELLGKVADTCRLLKVDKLLVENKAAGISVSQELRRVYNNEKYAIQLSDPKSMDKLSRLYAVQHIFADGTVYAPDRAWADMVITQVGQFPKGKHDDLVDTCSMGLKHLRELGLLSRAPERAAEIESKKIYPRGQDAPLYPA